MEPQAYNPRTQRSQVYKKQGHPGLHSEMVTQNRQINSKGENENEEFYLQSSGVI